MAVESVQKTEEKQGLFAYGYEAGQSLPWLDELGIQNRVGSLGEVQWVVSDRQNVWFDFTYPYREHLIAKEERIRHALFKAWHAFMMALLGYPVSRMSNEDLVMTVPLPARPSDLPTLWERAPLQVQETAVRSAAEYAEPQMSLRGR